LLNRHHLDMTIHLYSLQVGEPRQLFEPDIWTTAFYKGRVDGPVRLSRLNLAGDRQADLTVHGGLDKAVCVYSNEHYASWSRELGVDGCGPGWFGENFTVSNLNEDTACIGDVYAIGTAVVEVSQPRGPCWKLARRWNRLDLPKRVLRANRTGWYFRVIEEGDVAAGQDLELRERPFPKWTIARVNRLMYLKSESATDRRELANCPALAQSWRTALHKFGQ
jgi:MOSC domain-containing protein YiiM